METEQTGLPNVHEVLAQSYLSFLVLCILGLFFDTFFPMKIHLSFAVPLGITFFALGPLLMFWAQYASRHFARTRESGVAITQSLFRFGPYKYLRNPTHIGLSLLVWGYALISSSSMLFVTTFLATLVSNYFFRKHEQLLVQKYGEAYKQYRAAVPLIM